MVRSTKVENAYLRGIIALTLDSVPLRSVLESIAHTIRRGTRVGALWQRPARKSQFLVADNPSGSGDSESI